MGAGPGVGPDPLQGIGPPGRRGATSGAATADARIARARELHRRAIAADELAAASRAERDRLLRQVRAEDPRRWSYGTLATVLGCSRELIALIIKREHREE